VYGPPTPTGPEAVDGYIDRVRLAGRRATELLGGPTPPTT
jgi:hypothetical protein